MPSRLVRLPADPPFELWLAHLSAGPADEDLQLLDARELARAARFHFEHDRRRYVAAHAALRRVLAARTGRPPAALELQVGEHGKPWLAGVPHCAFSLSRSDDRALIALADEGEIGIDLERVRPLPDLDALVQRCLARSERDEVDGLAQDARALAFLERWTRKEACLKALGTGLLVEPSTFAVGRGAAIDTVSVATPSGPRELRVQPLELGPGWVAALARETTRHSWG